ncbi:MAG: PilZ domain-containing protein, partial [Planctomycetota bacterium]
MLHDSIQSRMTGASNDDRRRHDRVPFPSEITLVWHHDLAHPLRYRIIDASDGGLRILSSTPLLEGMTGTVLRLLPEGQSIGRAV